MHQLIFYSFRRLGYIQRPDTQNSGYVGEQRRKGAPSIS